MDGKLHRNRLTFQRMYYMLLFENKLTLFTVSEFRIDVIIVITWVTYLLCYTQKRFMRESRLCVFCWCIVRALQIKVYNAIFVWKFFQIWLNITLMIRFDDFFTNVAEFVWADVFLELGEFVLIDKFWAVCTNPNCFTDFIFFVPLKTFRSSKAAIALLTLHHGVYYRAWSDFSTVVTLCRTLVRFWIVI